MGERDEPLEEEAFDVAATRPPMMLGLPHTLAASLLFAGTLFVIGYGTGDVLNDLVADAVAVGALAMVWSAAKVLLRTDYHGWDNFIHWCRLDMWCLDTAEWGGARLASLPLRSPYRTLAGVLGDAD